MNFLFEPSFWMLLAASLSAWTSLALLRSIGKIRMAAALTVWTAATGTTFLICGGFAATLSAALSVVAGGSLLIGSLIRSGVKSMPNRRFEER